MKEPTEWIDFRANVRNASPKVVAATKKSTSTALRIRANVIETFGEERWQRLRKAGHDLRLHTLTHLDRYLPLLEEK